MIELNKIYNEDCLQTMAGMPDNSIDSIITDPPYELGFMGKAWDKSGIAYSVELWKEVLRVLKPGGYLLSFGGTRTSHRMVCAIEDAGFEIRDSILWLFGSGFPKSLNICKAIDEKCKVARPTEKRMVGDISNGRYVGKAKSPRVEREVAINEPQTEKSREWSGWGTALKPAHEPICMARKPLSEKTVAENVLRYGTGGINIDGSRIESNAKKWSEPKGGIFKPSQDNKATLENNPLGRFPANVILDEFAAGELDKQAPEAGAFAPVKRGQKRRNGFVYGQYPPAGDDGDTFYDDKGGASRFFYIAKADREERNAGLHQFTSKPLNWSSGTQNPGSFQSENTNRSSQNFHPTVKPVKLIQYLQRLVTPPNGITYDPFGGSGTSAIAAQNEGFKWILSEISSDYCDIANK